MNVSLRGAWKLPRVPVQPRAQLANLGADGAGAMLHFLQRQEPVWEVWQLLHRACP